MPEVSGALDLAAEYLPEILRYRVGSSRSWTAREVQKHVWLCQLGVPSFPEMPAVYVLLCQKCDGVWLLPWLQPIGIYPADHEGCEVVWKQRVQGWVRVRAREGWVQVVQGIIALHDGEVPTRPAVRTTNRTDEFWVEAWFPPAAAETLRRHKRVRGLAVEVEPTRWDPEA